MIAYAPSMAGRQDVTLWLKPNRALTHRALRALAWSIGVLAVATGLIGEHQGNVFAPWFALLEAIAAAWALSIAWRGGGRCERITLDRRLLEVETLPGHRRFSFQSGWVRVLVARVGTRQCLLLSSHGRKLEIGAFLGEEERVELGQKLRRLLAQVTAPVETPDTNKRAPTGVAGSQG